MTNYQLLITNYQLLFLLDVAPSKPINGSSLSLAIGIGSTFFLFAIGLIVFFASRGRLAQILRWGILLILPTIGAVFGYFIWQTTQAEYQRNLEKYRNESEYRQQNRQRQYEERKKLEEQNNLSNENANSSAYRNLSNLKTNSSSNSLNTNQSNSPK